MDLPHVPHLVISKNGGFPSRHGLTNTTVSHRLMTWRIWSTMTGRKPPFEQRSKSLSHSN